MATTKNLSKGVALLGAVALCCVALYAGRLRRVAVPAADHHTPLVAAPGLRCFSSGALAATPRFQSFCFVDRLCHDTRNVFHVPRPRRGTLSARAVRAWGALASQHRLAVSASDLWRDYAQSTDVLFYSGLSTAHFPEWVDAPLFLFAYQRNAWRWKLPRVHAFVDTRNRRSRDAVVAFMNPFRDMVVNGTGVQQVFSFQRPPPRHTCFRAVLHFVAELEDDARFSVTSRETSKQTRKVRWARDGTVRSVPTPVVVKSEYNVGPRRHFVGYNDSALWRHLVLHHATPHRVSHPPTPSCCGNSSEYRAEVRLALAVASPPPMAAPSDRSERPRRKEFRVVMLQRSQGRVFANISDVAACVAMEIAAQNPGIDVNVSIVAFEGASLRFQQQQLLDADMFVNVHGAGGINYLWLSPCAVFLDYFSFNHFTPRYFGPPAENMNLVYTPAHFMPPPDQIPKCMPQDLRGPGHSYTCMNHRHWSCRQCSRDHSTRIAPPCTSLRTVLRAALLRQDLCRLEMDVGVPPHTWNPHEFVAFGGSVEAYEKRKEVYREDDAMARVARLQMLLRQVQQAT